MVYVFPEMFASPRWNLAEMSWMRIWVSPTLVHSVSVLVFRGVSPSVLSLRRLNKIPVGFPGVTCTFNMWFITFK